MRQWIHAANGKWLTQSESNPTKDARIFIKSLPVNNPSNWVEWTDEQKMEYEKDHLKGEAAFNAFKQKVDLPTLMKEFGLVK